MSDIKNCGIPTISKKVRITFTEPLLGSQPSNSEIYRDYLAGKMAENETLSEDDRKKRTDEEAEAIDNLNADSDDDYKGVTVFSRYDDGTPHLWDFQIRGFFKHACAMLAKVTGTKSGKIKAYKKYIDGQIFIDERKITLNTDKDIQLFQRPLRAQTAQGERIALACSEMVSAGATAEFTVTVFDTPDKLMDAVVEWLNYGAFNGLGQWHNGGMGRFTWEEIK